MGSSIVGVSLAVSSLGMRKCYQDKMDNGRQRARREMREKTKVMLFLFFFGVVTFGFTVASLTSFNLMGAVGFCSLFAYTLIAFFYELSK
ncbi:MAG: hypothetical protein U9O89_01185 [Thermoproteota archaeon]|nr:hypothetical protein [Thermoproteota archaeon]